MLSRVKTDYQTTDTSLRYGENGILWSTMKCVIAAAGLCHTFLILYLFKDFKSSCKLSQTPFTPPVATKLASYVVVVVVYSVNWASHVAYLSNAATQKPQSPFLTVFTFSHQSHQPVP